MYKVVDLFAGAGGLSLGFEMQLQRENQYGINRYILLKKLDSTSSKDKEIIA